MGRCIPSIISVIMVPGILASSFPALNLQVAFSGRATAAAFLHSGLCKDFLGSSFGHWDRPAVSTQRSMCTDGAWSSICFLVESLIAL